MLDRIGDEVARATTVVRFAPGRRFPSHVHRGGEEFLVLEGVFTDATGDYRAGTYVRNPVNSEHAPWTDGGCTLLVKLRQMWDETEPHVARDTGEAAPWQADAAAPGRRTLPLFSSERTGEAVRMERLEPGAAVERERAAGGEEFYVVAGSFVDEEGARQEESAWARYPAAEAGTPVRWAADPKSGCTVWVKTGHLTDDTIRRCAELATG